MPSQPAWQWNEVQQVGTDYADMAEVERYERRMSEFRDLAAEDASLLAALALAPGSHVLEIGTGTGHFARAAAKAGHRVTALDVSPAMLQYAEAQARAQGLADMRFSHAGFLTLDEPAARFDAVVSVAALHHLPDLWKAVALQNVRRVLKPDGLFLLCDVVFASTGEELHVQFDGFVHALPQGMRKETIRHIAREYSTLDWIMEGLLLRAGFRILRTTAAKSPLLVYLCQADKG